EREHVEVADRRATDRLAVDERAGAARQILDEELTPDPDDPGVLPRDARILHAELIFRPRADRDAVGHGMLDAAGLSRPADDSRAHSEWDPAHRTRHWAPQVTSSGGLSGAAATSFDGRGDRQADRRAPLVRLANSTDYSRDFTYAQGYNAAVRAITRTWTPILPPISAVTSSSTALGKAAWESSTSRAIRCSGARSRSRSSRSTTRSCATGSPVRPARRR